MRIVLFVNNRAGLEVTRYLVDSGERIVGLAVHPPGRRKFADEILDAVRLPPEAVFDGGSLMEPGQAAGLRALEADIGISVMFGYILRKEVLSLFPRGCVNLHTAYLPFNRGANPNFWSIVEGTTAGVTLHYMDEGVDTGDLIARRKVEVEPVDTGGSLYAKLEAAALELFRETWPLLKAGRAPRTPQPQEGTSHRVQEFNVMSEIDLEREYRAGDLVDLLRAKTFPPYPGAIFRAGRRRVSIRVELEYLDGNDETG